MQVPITHWHLSHNIIAMNKENRQYTAHHQWTLNIHSNLMIYLSVLQQYKTVSPDGEKKKEI